MTLIVRKNWTAKNGVVHVIKEMDTKYLRNCIAKIKRDNWRKSYLYSMEKELEARMGITAPDDEEFDLQEVLEAEEEDRYSAREI
jgi:hypothetical protein